MTLPTPTQEQVDHLREELGKGRTPADIAGSLARVNELTRTEELFYQELALKIRDGEQLPDGLQ